ncbi:MAG TPA: hypothetical protein DET40_24100 [Lentisphaeria bacterium]|nr:MAG: hypothetical protein A2X45_08965 [Lentisphaerae bacterium GWF2_50_93]HCE46642.1 hypothetical protein [Lentisphaeria bacterium]
MKNMLFAVVMMVLFCSCSSTPPPGKPAKDAPDVPGIAPAEMKDSGNLDTGYKDNKRRLELAILARDKYMEIMRSAKTMEEADKAKSALDRAQQDVEFLQLELEEKPEVKFKHVTTLYGPLGWVLLITEFTFKRLYILYEW